MRMLKVDFPHIQLSSHCIKWNKLCFYPNSTPPFIQLSRPSCFKQLKQALGKEGKRVWHLAVLHQVIRRTRQLHFQTTVSIAACLSSTPPATVLLDAVFRSSLSHHVCVHGLYTVSVIFYISQQSATFFPIIFYLSLLPALISKWAYDDFARTSELEAEVQTTHYLILCVSFLYLFKMQNQSQQIGSEKKWRLLNPFPPVISPRRLSLLKLL